MTKNTTRKAPALDLSTLAPTAAELPKQERQHRDNPFVAWLTESFENDNAGRKVTVPAANVSEVEYLIRKAAQDLNIGSRVVVQKNGKTLDKDARKSATGSVDVLFSAKNRKQRKAKDTDSA